MAIDDTPFSKEDASKAHALIEEEIELLKTQPLDEVFLWIEARIAEYPENQQVAFLLTRVFDGHRDEPWGPCDGRYDSRILDCYERALREGGEKVRLDAAEALFHAYLRKGDYGKAEAYLAYFPESDPERKRKQALVFNGTGRKDDALKAYEELLYTGYQSLSTTLSSLYYMAMEQDDVPRAHMFAEKMHGLAHLFEFGDYHEVSPGLELAIAEQDVEETLRIAECMLIRPESIGAFMQSPLYAHMGFSGLGEGYIHEMRESLLEGFKDEETYSYMKGDHRWEELLDEAGRLV